MNETQGPVLADVRFRRRTGSPWPGAPRGVRERRPRRSAGGRKYGRGGRESYDTDAISGVSTRARRRLDAAPGRRTPAAPARISRTPALRRLADALLESTSLEAMARLLTEDLPRALAVARATVLLWNRRLDSFQALTPGDGSLSAVRPGKPVAAPEAGFLLSDGVLLPTPGGVGEGVLVPLMARSGLVGMLVLGARAGRRRVPFRPTEARLLSVLAARAAIAVENLLYQRELIASERMAVLGTMAGMLAHDFRNPMTVIRGYAELLLDDDLPRETAKAHVETVIRMIDRLDRMTAETLDFARAGGVVVRRTVALRATLEEIVSDLARELPGLALEPRLDLAPAAVGSLDTDKLRRVLGNLAGNARDAMKGRGRLGILARLVPGTAPGAQRLLIEVADDGPGVPPEVRDTLFEPFVTHGKKGGTGLGLAVARRFVEDHGGTVELLREAPKDGFAGARFRILLPLEAPPPGPSGAGE